MKMLTRRGVLVEEMGQTCLAEPDAARGRSAPAAVRRHRRVRPACRGACGSARPQAAGAVVTLHHRSRAVGRTGAAQRRRAGGAEARDALPRRHDASGAEAGRRQSCGLFAPAEGPKLRAGAACKAGPAVPSQPPPSPIPEGERLRSGNVDATPAAPVVIATPSAVCSAKVLPGDAARRVGAALPNEGQPWDRGRRSRPDESGGVAWRSEWAPLPRSCCRVVAGWPSGLAGALEIPT
jgi:hypothetical protein